MNRDRKSGMGILPMRIGKMPMPLIVGANLILLLFFALAISCGEKPEPKTKPADTLPTRIISLAPNLTEIVYALGEQNRLVGVTQYCRFPPEAAQKPSVGALANMDYEKIRSLKPDLALVVPGQRDFAQRFQQLGIPSLTVKSESIDDIYAGIVQVGIALNREELARQKVAELKEKMEAIRTRYGGVSPKPRVLWVVGRNPGTLQQIYGAGTGTFLDEMMRAVGVVNVLGDTPLPYPVLSKERIIALDPDLILDSSSGQAGEVEKSGFHMKAWDELQMLSAVRAGKIVRVRDDHLLIPGPGFAENAERLAALVYEPAAETHN